MALNKRKILDAAQKYLQKGNLDRALKEYQKVVDADPRDTNVRLKIGDVQLRRGKSDEAIQSYLEVAQLFMKGGFDAKAVALYKQISKIDEKRYDIYEPLAELYQRMGLTSEAMTALQTAAEAHQREGRKKEGLALLRKMASLDPSNTATRIKIAEMLWKEDLQEEALAEYDEVVAELGRQQDLEGVVRVHEAVLRHLPERMENLIGLGSARLELGHPEKADIPLLKATEVDVESVSAWEALARAHEALGRRRDMEDAWRTVAAIHKDRGNDDRAKEILQLYVTSEGLSEDGELDEEAGGTTLGDLSADSMDDLEIGSEEPAAPPVASAEPAAAPEPAPELDLDDADDEIEIELDEEISQVGLGTAAPASSQGPEPAAAGEAASATEADPAQLLAEAGVYLRYSQHDKAVHCLEQILESKPDHLEALEKLGEARQAVGDAAAAVTLWKEAAEYARGAGNQEAFDVLCERIRDVDEAAAESLAADALAPSLADEEPDLDLDLEFDTPSGEPELTGDAEASALDLEIDLLDDGLGATGEVEAAPEASAEAAGPASGGEEAGSLSDRFSVPAGGVRLDGGSDSGEVASEDLEEAEFYFRQGLLDEAEQILKRLLAVAPNHPQVLLRLGEIAKSRGESPSKPVAPDADFDSTEDETHPGGASADSTVEDLDGVPPAGDPPAGPDDVTVQVDPDDLDDVDVSFDDDDDPRDATLEGETAPAIDLSRSHEPAQGEGPAEGEGFDLAAELEDVFDDTRGSVSADQSIGGTTQAGFESIFQSFKEGVKETLGEGEYETHYDLGIAYREMGLFEDAVGEFRSALGSPGRKLDCLALMGLCALDLGRADDAVAHLEQVLAMPGLEEDRLAGLRFDLGRAFRMKGDVDRTRELWEQVKAFDPAFQDVSACLERLGEADDSIALGDPPPARGAAEALESFDDLIAEAEADLGDDDDDDPDDPDPDDPSSDMGSTQWGRKISYG